MNLLEKEPYIKGQLFSREATAPARLTMDVFKKAIDTLAMAPLGEQNLDCCELSKSFYRVEPDVRDVVPEELRDECFYAMKLGYFSKHIPAQAMYWIMKAYNQYKIPNLIFKLIPDRVFTIMSQQDYLADGYCLQDAVCSLTVPTYTPLSLQNLCVKHEDFAEIYIAKTDMVAAVPLKIAELLSPEDIRNIDVDENGLHIQHHYLRSLAGYVGAINSVYDLRRVI